VTSFPSINHRQAENYLIDKGCGERGCKGVAKGGRERRKRSYFCTSSRGEQENAMERRRRGKRRGEST
jgi:hypothetical protein